jgi:crotonobetainyl-CoA:carnitine CoA-transferase CaiB-like acyl-CoA transferase
MMWLTGGAQDGPVAVGLPIGDVLAGAALAHGVLALLFRRERHGIGGLVETSLMEVLADLQFELLTTWLNDGGRMPRRSAQNPAHAYLAAPYGIYGTADGHLAIAMGKLDILAGITGVDAATAGLDPFIARDQIKAGLAMALAAKPTEAWMEAFIAADIWAAPVLDWQQLVATGMMDTLDMLQEVARGDVRLRTTRLPIKFDGTRPAARRAAPALGDSNDLLSKGWGTGNG